MPTHEANIVRWKYPVKGDMGVVKRLREALTDLKTFGMVRYSHTPVTCLAFKFDTAFHKMWCQNRGIQRIVPRWQTIRKKSHNSNVSQYHKTHRICDSFMWQISYTEWWNLSQVCPALWFLPRAGDEPSDILYPCSTKSREISRGWISQSYLSITINPSLAKEWIRKSFPMSIES